MEQMTQDQKHIYTEQLKRLGMIIQKRIEDEFQKSAFLDIYSTIGDSVRLNELKALNHQLGNNLNTYTSPTDLESVINTLRRVEFKLQRDRYEEESLEIFAGSKKTNFYEIELAKHLATVNQRFPEDTSPHLLPFEKKQLPDAAGPVGGKKKKTKKTKKNIKKSNRGTSKQ